MNTVRADGAAIVPIQITMPRQPDDPPHVQKTITVNVPASCIHNNKLQVSTNTNESIASFAFFKFQ